MFERMNCGFASHGGEILKKLIQSLPTFQIVQQSLERDARSSKDRRPAENVRVLGDYFIPLGRHAFPLPNLSQVYSQ
jgi:hypothetical protein